MRAEVEQAVETLRQGRGDGIEKALTLLQNTVFSFSMKVCGHRQDAEDTMQETLLTAVPYLQRFENPKALAVWLYKVARSRCLMSRRQSKFAPAGSLSIEALMPERSQLEWLQAAGSTPEQAVLESETQEQLQRAVLKLPPAYRLVLVLHDMEGLSTDEIARVLQLLKGTVRVRLHRARVFLRNELARATSHPRPRRKKAPRPPRRCKQLFAELSDYLDAAADDALCEELEKHMAGCQPCQAFLASLERTVERCRRHRPARLSPQQAARTRAALLVEYRRALQALQPAKR